MMELVVTIIATSRAMLQSNHHHQQTNIKLFTGRMRFLSPNRQCQSTEGSVICVLELGMVIDRKVFGSTTPPA